MKVYILFNAYSEKIECVFKNWKDADDMLKSFKGSKDIFIEEHEVIE
jgi:hypothetical protein